ncbi:MAG TPA: tetratricopeptide repeat protein, partial [Candidatus Omnitrophota bacterium]|nr:tetratricopeptide repeat protein [Candidatus Omnitrophota bacterium]
ADLTRGNIRLLAMEYANRGIYGKALTDQLKGITNRHLDEYVFYNGTKVLDGDGEAGQSDRSAYKRLETSGVGVGGEGAGAGSGASGSSGAAGSFNREDDSAYLDAEALKAMLAEGARVAAGSGLSAVPAGAVLYGSNSAVLRANYHEMAQKVAGLVLGLNKVGLRPQINDRPLSELAHRPQDLVQFIIDFSILETAEEIAFALQSVMDASTGKALPKGMDLQTVFALYTGIFEQEKYLQLYEHKPLRIVVFRGGTGAVQITKLLKKLPNVEVHIVLGATDDGRSWFIGAQDFNATGIPDAGKCLLDLADDSALKALMSYRFKHVTPEQSRSIFSQFIRMITAGADQAEALLPQTRDLLTLFEALDGAQKKYIANYLQAFEEKYAGIPSRRDPKERTRFHFVNIPVRSPLLVGAAWFHQAEGVEDYWQYGIDKVASLLAVEPHRVYFATSKRQHLMGMTIDGEIFFTETGINEFPRKSDFLGIWLTEEMFDVASFEKELASQGIELEPVQVSDHVREDARKEIADTIRKVKSGRHIKAVVSAISRRSTTVLRDGNIIQSAPCAHRAILDADIMIYANTTLESNQGSALIVPGIQSAIRLNERAAKVLFVNPTIENDPKDTTALNLVERIYRYVSGQQHFETTFMNWNRGHQYIDFVIGHGMQYPRRDVRKAYIPFEEGMIHKQIDPLVKVIGMNLEFETPVLREGKDYNHKWEEYGFYSAQLMKEALIQAHTIKTVRRALSERKAHLQIPLPPQSTREGRGSTGHLGEKWLDILRGWVVSRIQMLAAAAVKLFSPFSRNGSQQFMIKNHTNKGAWAWLILNTWKLSAQNIGRATRIFGRATRSGIMSTLLSFDATVRSKDRLLPASGSTSAGRPASSSGTRSTISFRNVTGSLSGGKGTEQTGSTNSAVLSGREDPLSAVEAGRILKGARRSAQTNPAVLKIEDVEPVLELATVMEHRKKIGRFVERPLVAACEELYDKNIFTAASSANRNDALWAQAGEALAYLTLDHTAMSPENQELARGMIEGRIILPVGVSVEWNEGEASHQFVRILVEIKAETPVSEVENKTVAVARMFGLQRVLLSWSPDEMRAELGLGAKARLSRLKEAGYWDGRRFKRYYYDETQKRFYYSAEHARKDASALRTIARNDQTNSAVLRARTVLAAGLAGLVALSGCDKKESPVASAVNEIVPAAVSPATEISRAVIEKMKQQVRSLEYSDKVADDFVKMVSEWKNEQGQPLVASWEQRLDSARREQKQGKTTLAQLVGVEVGVLGELARKIAAEYGSNDSAFELTDVIEKKQAQCVSRSVFIVILGSSFGFDVEAIHVDLQESRNFGLTDEQKTMEHAAVVVHLSDVSVIVADAALNFVSQPFVMDAVYTMVGNYFELKGWNGPAQIHGRIRKTSVLAEINFNRANGLGREGRLADAITVYTKAIDLDSKFVSAYNNRGIVYGRMGQLTEAMTDYTRAIEFDSKYAVAYSNRGNVYGALGQFTEAVSDETKAIQLNPKLTIAYFFRGMAYIELRRLAEASADFTKAIELDPKNSKAYYSRGTVHLALRRSSEAIEDFTKLIELGMEKAIIYFQRGNAYAQLKQWNDAITNYTKAIEIEPKFVEPHVNRANSYVELNRWEEAVADYTKAIDLGIKNAVVYYSRGRGYGILGRFTEAIVDYTKAVELDPKDYMSYGNRGMAYLQVGRLQNAKEDLLKALELTPGEKEKERVREVLRWIEEELKVEKKNTNGAALLSWILERESVLSKQGARGDLINRGIHPPWLVEKWSPLVPDHFDRRARSAAETSAAVVVSKTNTEDQVIQALVAHGTDDWRRHLASGEKALEHFGLRALDRTDHPPFTALPLLRKVAIHSESALNRARAIDLVMRVLLESEDCVDQIEAARIVRELLHASSGHPLEVLNRHLQNINGAKAKFHLENVFKAAKASVAGDGSVQPQTNAAVLDGAQENRIEFKYLVELGREAEIEDWVKAHMVLDSYSKKRPENGYRYPIFSVYLDNGRLTTYYATLDGLKNRFKLRVRWYSPTSPVFFEIKRKIGMSQIKHRGMVKREAVWPLLAGDFPSEEYLYSLEKPGKNLAALNRFVMLMQDMEAVPKAYTFYYRKAYMPREGGNHLRITFDHDLCTLPFRQHYGNGILVPDMSLAKPVWLPGMFTLEIKHTDTFPRWVSDMVRHFNLQRTGVPKYVGGVSLIKERPLLFPRGGFDNGETNASVLPGLDWGFYVAEIPESQVGGIADVAQGLPEAILRSKTKDERPHGVFRVTPWYHSMRSLHEAVDR